MRLAEQYRRFAELEARGRSPLYEVLAQGVAGDMVCLDFLATLPEAMQQPNLLFAALRHVCGTPRDWAEFRTQLAANAEAIRATMLARRTQTNEVGRCATLLPALAQLPQPLALIEVGASAGLCLLPDRYGYDYGTHRLAAPTDAAPVLRCRAGSGTPLPAALPHVVWRAGLDLDPVDLSDAAQRAWLETLVWPEQTDRLQRLRAAMAVAQEDPPRVVRGDLRTDLPALAHEAPADATLVVFHSAVLAYLPDGAARAAFARCVRDLGAVWISNEAPGVFPALRERLTGRGSPGAFLLAVDGNPVAWTDAHGAWIDWIEPQREARTS
ncbi:MAG TPA: DUF2332 domain-containing protein [Acetobacteraceae bacterium]|jgi:hypothetical protein